MSFLKIKDPIKRDLIVEEFLNPFTVEIPGRRPHAQRVIILAASGV